MLQITPRWVWTEATLPASIEVQTYAALNGSEHLGD
jgi:hypothetical protein